MKNKRLQKVTVFYDKRTLMILFITFLAFGVAFCLSVFIFPSTTHSSIIAAKYDSYSKICAPIILPFLIYFLRRRVVSSNGISATFLGVKYKHISWNAVRRYHFDRYAPKWATDKERMSRDVLVFVSTPKANGKSVVIVIDATPSVIELVETYYGKPHAD